MVVGSFFCLRRLVRGGHEVWLQRECVPHVCSVKLIATGESQNLKFRAASANAVSLANSDESLFMISESYWIQALGSCHWTSLCLPMAYLQHWLWLTMVSIVAFSSWLNSPWVIAKPLVTCHCGNWRLPRHGHWNDVETWWGGWPWWFLDKRRLLIEEEHVHTLHLSWHSPRTSANGYLPC